MDVRIGDKLRLDYVDRLPDQIGLTGIVTEINEHNYIYGTWSDIYLIPYLDEWTVIERVQSKTN